MNCKKIREILRSDYLDGRLSGDELRLVSGHLAGCPDCRRLEKELQVQREVFRKAGQVQPPGQIWQNIRDNIAGERLEEENEARGGIFERLRQLLWRPRPVFALTGTLTAVALIAIFFFTASVNRQYAAKENNNQVLADYRVNSDADNPAYGLGTAVEEYFL